MNLPRVGDVTIEEGTDRWMVVAVVRDGQKVAIHEALIPEGEGPEGYNVKWTRRNTSDRERLLVRAAS